MSFEGKTEQGFRIRSQTVEIAGMRTGDRGFHMTFENGWTISVQFGTYNYCSARNQSIEDDRKWLDELCPDAEVAIFDPTGAFVNFKSGDSVRGWSNPDDVALIMGWVQSQGQKQTKSASSPDWRINA